MTDLIRIDAGWHERWEGPDKGLIACWECGRERALEKPSLAAATLAGELVLLPWRGGIDKDKEAAKEKGQKKKFGALNYVAMWQGLRGEDLNIDTESGAVITCTATSITVIFSGNQKTIANA